MKEHPVPKEIRHHSLSRRYPKRVWLHAFRKGTWRNDCPQTQVDNGEERSAGVGMEQGIEMG